MSWTTLYTHGCSDKHCPQTLSSHRLSHRPTCSSTFMRLMGSKDHSAIAYPEIYLR